MRKKLLFEVEAYLRLRYPFDFEHHLFHKHFSVTVNGEEQEHTQSPFQLLSTTSQ
jgi:hypothetical protein